MLETKIVNIESCIQWFVQTIAIPKPAHYLKLPVE